ncbi:DUF971 domain-containing protein [Pseudomonas typographi]|uniref:DUF971 domain-containing protein n=1 Tax=Pseudomonas typographi TaxID=2715964 RepID=A0ABR7Z543_9PSED|nr:DUF971 domain-containing protein [Pseudomonas typographi]MBD1553051.1 DUF971 domain-containing protein [Pseudomonas typographi]MBD1588422.1 DUF971 domain-containing protein [Pseudomonas typographi]MBD1600503.1 DUF971 domain-containing protein [Pseudomonas typographi]
MSGPRSIDNRRAARLVEIDWPGRGIQRLNYLQLRAACPCSTCRASRLRGVEEVTPVGVAVVQVNLQGYGVQLVFSDGHDRGIYPWAYLKGLG